MLTLTAVLGHAAEPALAERLHHLAHHGAVEYLEVAPQDASRHRLRLVTDRGTDCAIALPREAHLDDGAVLLLETDRAIVVRLGAQRWIRLTPADAATALELGYLAGNLHWQVRFDGEALLVARHGPLDDYRARLAPLLAAARVTLDDDG